MTFAQTSYTASESEDLRIKLSLNRALSVPVDVQILDDQPPVRIPVGATRAIFVFPVADNNICGDDFSFPLIIVPQTPNCVAGDPDRAIANIVDDDGEL